MRQASVLAAIFLATISTAYAANGKVSIGPTDWCASTSPEDHLTIYVKGPAANDLLTAIKPNGPDKSFTEIGMIVYASQDGMVQCDTTDPANIFCSIGFDLKASKVEPVTYCE